MGFTLEMDIHTVDLNKTAYKKFYIPFEKNRRHREQPKVYQINGNDEYSIGFNMTKVFMFGKNKQKLYEFSTGIRYLAKKSIYTNMASILVALSHCLNCLISKKMSK